MRRLNAAVAVLAAVTVAGGIQPATAAAGSGAGTGRAAGADDRGAAARGGQVVTLVTGDRVHVRARQQRMPAVSVEPAAGRTGVTFAVRASRDRISVVSSDAAPLLAAGRLDPRLFDVTGLLAAGYDDAHRSELPLIVRYAGSAGDRSAARAAAGRATTVTRTLDSIGAAAVAERKAAAATFWASVTRPARVGSAARVLDAGFDRIWLDGRVSASLDRSVPQIGAPAAWQAGFTGKDVKVAVLDSGIDADHPDLAGAVAAAEDFSGSPSGTADRYGHGTHVASIITGSGAASGGRYAGVAPDATLLNGKVLDDTGSGTESQIIDGMEWATGQGAKVVNMSLGRGYSDGTDPLSLAVNRLSEQTGTLFVIAAGNDGVIASPAAADAALTVGSVDREDRVSDTSGRGPRPYDPTGAVKPDLTAPGVGIVAARAAGTELGAPVDDRYTALSGTSMATPHAAGAAAILAQRHQDWTAGKLKAALMGAAKPVPGDGVYAQGAGRLDVARAVAQQVSTDTPTLSAPIRWPWPAEPVEKTVTYRNDGATPVTLELSVQATDPNGEPAPAGLVRVVEPRVTVPAHGTVSVPLHIDSRVGAAATPYAARLTAAGGDVTVQTTVGLLKEPEAYDLTITAVDRAGRLIKDPAGFPPPVLADVTDDPDRNPYSRIRLVDGAWVARAAKGRYSLTAGIRTLATDGTSQSSTFVSVPEIVLERNTPVRLDARRGVLVRTRTDSRTARPSGAMVGVQDRDSLVILELPGGPGKVQEPVYAVPTRQARSSPYTFLYQQSLDEPAAAGSDTAGSDTASGDTGRPTGYDLVFTYRGEIPARLDHRVRDRDLAVVDHRLHADQPLAGRLYTDPVLPGPDAASWFSFHHPVPMPGRVTRFQTAATPDGPVSWNTSVYGVTENGRVAVSEGSDHDRGLPTYAAGRRHREDWNEAAIGPVVDSALRIEDTLVLSAYGFASSAVGHKSFDDPEMQTSVQKMTLRRDGEVIGEADNSSSVLMLEAEVAPEQATYQLDVDGERTRPWTALATRVHARWTFGSAHSGPESAHLALPNVRIDGAFDARNRAPAGRPFALDLRIDAWGDVKPTPARTVTLEASFDDGRTWRQVPVSGAGDRFRATVPHPAGAGFVSLRASAETADGARVEQTVTRAYALR